MKFSSGFLFITVLWIISIFIVNPLGEFPLNDDWCYAKSVLTLCEQGKMTIHYWAAMTLVAQISYGALFCKIFGFSFLTLRILTLITALLGIFTFYRLAFSFSSDKKLALLASLVLFFNPIFFSLSFTFLTDVHFFTFSIIAVFFYFKYMEREKMLDIVLATVFSIISVLIRQPGILFPLVFSLSVFYKNRTIISLVKSSIPFILTLTTLLLHGLWLKTTENGANVVGIQGALSSLSSLIDIYTILVRLSYCILYLGLFLLPFSIIYWKDLKEYTTEYITKYKFKVLFVLVPFVVLLLVGGVHYPIGNILYNFGLGPKTLKDGFHEVNISPQLHEQLWIVSMKLISIIGSIMMMLLLYKTINKQKQESAQSTYSQPQVYIGIFTGLYVILLIINRVYFDRHLILLVALITLLILPRKIEYTPLHRNIAISCLLLMMGFSIGGTHDYLSWNRARLEATNYLNHELKIEPNKIDGGFEYNGWHETGPYVYSSDIDSRSWWWIGDDEYVIAFGDINRYKKIKAYPYPQLLTSQKDSIYILKRQ